MLWRDFSRLRGVNGRALRSCSRSSCVRLLGLVRGEKFHTTPDGEDCL